MADDLVQAAGLRIDRDGCVLRVTLDDPKRHNAQRPSTWTALADIGASLDHDIRVVVVCGTGPSFSSGLDRRMLEPGGIPNEPSLVDLARDEPSLETFIAKAQSAFTWWRESPAITIASVQGHAIGAGAQLMLACDLVVIAEDLQFGLKETSLGLIPDLGGTAALVERVGYHRALELCATGRLLGASEAMAIGLAEQVAPVDGLAAATEALIEQLLTAPSAALQSVKTLLRDASRTTYAEQLVRERQMQLPLLQKVVERMANRA